MLSVFNFNIHTENSLGKNGTISAWPLENGFCSLPWLLQYLECRGDHPWPIGKCQPRNLLWRLPKCWTRFRMSKRYFSVFLRSVFPFECYRWIRCCPELKIWPSLCTLWSWETLPLSVKNPKIRCVHSPCGVALIFLYFYLECWMLDVVFLQCSGTNVESRWEGPLENIGVYGMDLKPPTKFSSSRALIRVCCNGGVSVLMYYYMGWRWEESILSTGVLGALWVSVLLIATCRLWCLTNSTLDDYGTGLSYFDPSYPLSPAVLTAVVLLY